MVIETYKKYSLTNKESGIGMQFIPITIDRKIDTAWIKIVYPQLAHTAVALSGIENTEHELKLIS